MIQKYFILGKQRIQRKICAYWIKVKLLNLAFLALHGPAVTCLLNSSFLLLPSYLPFPSTHLHTCTSKRYCSQSLTFSPVPLFTAMRPSSLPPAPLLRSQGVQMSLFLQWLPQWHRGQEIFLGFPGSALPFLWLPEPWLTSYKKLHSVPF